MMKSIAGVVILYHPDKNEIVKNISSYIFHLDQLIIVDNTPEPDCEDLLKTFDNAIYLSNNKNLGIAAALNTAVNIALEKNYDWLLTMDQDSYFGYEEMKAYMNFFRADFINSNDVAVVAPRHEIGADAETKARSYHPVITAITSGSLINVEICTKMGGFEEKLFIDEVDFEYCYRCILAGYKIFQYDYVFLNHRLGNNVNTGYFSIIKRSNRILHNPVRVYYMVRNHLYLTSRYSKHFPAEFRKRRKNLIVTLKNNLLFSGQFFKVWRAAWKGYLDFRHNKFDVIKSV